MDKRRIKRICLSPTIPFVLLLFWILISVSEGDKLLKLRRLFCSTPFLLVSYPFAFISDFVFEDETLTYNQYKTEVRAELWRR